MDNMAGHFEFLERYLTFPWEEEDVPVFEAHFAVRLRRRTRSV